MWQSYLTQTRIYFEISSLKINLIRQAIKNRDLWVSKKPQLLKVFKTDEQMIYASATLSTSEKTECYQKQRHDTT